MRERLLLATERALDELRQAGKLLPVRLAPPEMPRPFAEALARVLEVEAGGPRQESLERHYLDLMPRLRAQQLCTAEEPAARFFQAPLRWDKLPHLSSAIERLQQLLVRVGAPALAVEGGTVGELYQTTFYGGLMPLLYGAPGDLAFFARAPGSLDEVLDRLLTAPLVHELTHLRRDRRVFPLYLDECVAGYLGVTVLRGFAYSDEGLYAAPWFLQVGQALGRVAGADNLWRAHAGVISWVEALPPGLAAAFDRLGWEDYLESRWPHLLSDNFHPDPWLKLMWLAQAGAPLERWTLPQLRALPWSEVPPGREGPMDAELVRDGLWAMCVHNHQSERSYRVSMRPPASAIEIDVANCRTHTQGGEHDPAGLAYLFPPAIGARLGHGYTLELRDLGAIDEVTRAIVDGSASREGDGYRLSVRPRPARRVADPEAGPA